jgi:hypothetical protein
MDDQSIGATGAPAEQPCRFGSLIVRLSALGLLLLGISACALKAAWVTAGWGLSTGSNIVTQILTYGLTNRSLLQSTVLGPQVTQYVVSNLSNGQTYFFMVQCLNSSNVSSDYSVPAFYTVPLDLPIAPPAPTNLHLISVP